MIQSARPFDDAFRKSVANEPLSVINADSDSADQRKADLASAFLESAERHSDQLAFITEQRALTYANLRDMAFDYADALVQSPDWSPGTFVALRLPNSADYIAAFYGILIAGGVVIPLPTGQTETWIKLVMQTTGCGLMIDHDGLHPYSSRFSIGPGGNNVKTATLNPSAMPDHATADIPGLAAIFFTSGSSGAPKGVMLSHTNLLANAESIQRSLPMESTDRTLALLPFCHAYGNSVLQSHLLCGAALVVAGSTAFPETIVDAMKTYSVTSFAGVPQLHQLIFRGSRISTEEVPSLRYVTVAGGALRLDLISEFADRIHSAKFYVMYGQTEATARLSCLPAEDLNTRRGSIGRGIPGVTLEVVDRQGDPVPPGVRGEIRASGDNIMLGYWNDSAATGDVLRDNWLYTGDLAIVDEDGFIYPQGRKNSLLKIAGYRLHPAEIEATITTQIPSVEAFVVPFEAVDGMTRLALFVVPLERTHLPDSNEIRQCCRNHLARFQRPDYISVLKRVPLTPSMKVDRQKLSKMATDAMLQRLKTTDAVAR